MELEKKNKMKKKTKILIVMHYMEIGGAETALIGLLNALDPMRVDVDLFLHDHRGPMMQFIPKWIKVLPPIKPYTMLERPILQVIKHGFILIALARMLAKILANWKYKKSGSALQNYCEFFYMSCFTTPLLPRINPNEHYDLAISFLTPHNITLKKTKAQRKVAWIHTDYSNLWMDRKREVEVWSKFYKIISISDDVTRTFLSVFPSLAQHVTLIENILSPNLIRRRSRAPLDDILWGKRNLQEIRILSIGRFSKEKNFNNIPDICKRIIEHGHNNIKWYLIGYGDDTDIRKCIQKQNMQNHVFILGKRHNPYPYIRECDIYVQPSLYEGKSITVREAQILCKPVVVTNYPTAHSQIKDKVDGVIVPMDNTGCAQGIAWLIKNVDLRHSITTWLSTHDYGNEKEVEKIYRLLPATNNE